MFDDNSMSPFMSVTTTPSRRRFFRLAAATATGIASVPGIAFALPGQPRRSEAAQRALGSRAFRELVPRRELPELRARLLANENPYGPGPAARAAAADAIAMGNRYQHATADLLRAEIAEFEGVPEEYVMITPGSSDALEKAAVVHFQYGGNIVAADPAYMSIIVAARGLGATWKEVPTTRDWQHDLPAMRAAVDGETKLIYVCNPNNPTGTLTDPGTLHAFCDAATDDTPPVFVDEAYLEFLPDRTGATMVPHVLAGRNVMVAKTFSKIHGMAGLRVGYLLAHPDKLAQIDQISRANMGLCRTSLEAARASLADTAFQDMSRERIAAAREQTRRGLEDLGFTPLDSHASFMLFPIAMPGEQMLDGMFERGIGVRAFEIHGEPHCRVSMGTPEEMELFLAAAGEVMVG